VADREKIFMKSLARPELFKNRDPKTLPPHPPTTPITVSWGTWFDAIVYYAENFKTILLCNK
jgi:hypothetical protein